MFLLSVSGAVCCVFDIVIVWFVCVLSRSEVLCSILPPSPPGVF